jgi:hypothetical protein
MDPHQQWCHNRNCRAYGRTGEGHVVIHSQKERRYCCKRCGRTFCETKGTVLYRIHKPKWVVLTVVTLLAYGCPVQAIGSRLRAGRAHRCPLAEGGRLSVQTGPRAPRGEWEGASSTGSGRRDQGEGGWRGVYWLASALEVRSRLWLGGVVSQHRDRQLIRRLLLRVRRCSLLEKVLLVTDGFASYNSQALCMFSGDRFILEGEVARGWCWPKE